MPDFVHLHLHTHYSTLDGMCQVPQLMKRAHEFGLKSLAITDHGNMYGVIDFYAAAEKAGIKPIIGFEAYVAPISRFEQKVREAHHLILLAKNTTGYHNLCRLCTAGFLEGFYYNPRVDKEILRKYAEGIIALSGCIGGEIPVLLSQNRFADAITAANEYREIFGAENFYLEIQNNSMPEQIALLPQMRELSQKTNIPLVATSDVHYINREHAKIQDIMLCINTGKKVTETNRMKMEPDDFYFKSSAEMYASFPDDHAACARTLEIAERCNFDLKELARDDHGVEQKFHLPKIKYDNDPRPTPEIFREKSLHGLHERYGEKLPDEITARFEYEHKVITQMGFPDYFLMVHEIVAFARKNDIPVGPGRGSAAGSIISYALKITDLDPLKYDLLFERFLNEGRNEMPDIDLDFDVDRRGEVVQFIKDRFGAQHCAQIITYNMISVKSAVRDVGRVLDIPLSEVNMIAKLIPDMLKAEKNKTTVDLALEQSPELKDLYDKDERVKEILDIAQHLDGVIRQTGIHAAGVLVADRPLVDFYGPLHKRGEGISFQYDMKKVEKLGLCKVDVLGLETLSLIRKAVDIIRQRTGKIIDINNLIPDDKPTFAMLARGDSKGVFQFESEGFRRLLLKMKPDRFEDLIAGVAMYRPGPLQCGMVDRYIDCKHHRAKPNYLHPLLENILGETYGEVLYQEQVQALALELAHFTLSEGDMMRRAMGKKDAALMEKYKSQFVKQAHNTVGEKIAAQIFDQVEQFASYGFNKSHSACYAYIAYQTAWLKAHYPREYMAALLTTNRGNTNKVVEYSEDARSLGIEVLPPDINESDAYFTVTDKENIRYGLAAVKGVGDQAVEGLAAERAAHGKFKSLFDFCERIDLRLLNKGTIDALIKAGAFDELGGHRAQYLAGLERALNNGQNAQKNRESGQVDLFGGDEADEESEPPLPNVAVWDEPTKLAYEKEVLGCYVSNHPLAQHAGLLKSFANTNTAKLVDLKDTTKVVIGGLISNISKRVNKTNQQWAIITLEDLSGSIEMMVFGKAYEENKALIKKDELVFVNGKVDRTRDKVVVIADKFTAMDQVIGEFAKSAVITLEVEDLANDCIAAIKNTVQSYKGGVPLYFQVHVLGGQLAQIRADREFSIEPSEKFIAAIRDQIGDEKLAFRNRLG